MWQTHISCVTATSWCLSVVPNIMTKDKSQCTKYDILLASWWINIRIILTVGLRNCMSQLQQFLSPILRNIVFFRWEVVISISAAFRTVNQSKSQCPSYSRSLRCAQRPCDAVASDDQCSSRRKIRPASPIQLASRCHSDRCSRRRWRLTSCVRFGIVSQLLSSRRQPRTSKVGRVGHRP